MASSKVTLSLLEKLDLVVAMLRIGTITFSVATGKSSSDQLQYPWPQSLRSLLPSVELKAIALLGSMLPTVRSGR